MTKQNASEQSRAVVDAYYQAGVQARLTEFAPYLLEKLGIAHGLSG